MRSIILNQEFNSFGRLSFSVVMILCKFLQVSHHHWGTAGVNILYSDYLLKFFTKKIGYSVKIDSKRINLRSPYW